MLVKMEVLKIYQLAQDVNTKAQLSMNQCTLWDSFMNILVWIETIMSRLISIIFERVCNIFQHLNDSINNMKSVKAFFISYLLRICNQNPFAKKKF